MKKRIVLGCLLLMSVAGCQTLINPETGEKESRINPADANSIEAVLNVSRDTAAGLSVIWADCRYYCRGIGRHCGGVY